MRLNYSASGSIYHLLKTRAAAEVAFALGFRDFDHPDERGVTPLGRLVSLHRGLELDYVEWLLEKGANPAHLAADVNDRGDWTTSGSSRTIAHKLMDKITRCYNHLQPEFPAIVNRIMSNHMVIEDECDCHCADAECGCSPTLVFLNRHICRELAFNHSLSAVLSSMYGVLKHCGMDEAPISRQLIRLFAFEALGCRHTCCIKLIAHRIEVKSYDVDFDEIREEDAPLLDRLERLVTELICDFEQCGCSILEFLETTGLQRMQEVADEVNGADLTDEERAGMRSLDVKLVLGSEASQSDKAKNKRERIYHYGEAHSYAFWAKEFERIVNGDFSEPIFHFDNRSHEGDINRYFDQFSIYWPQGVWK